MGGNQSADGKRGMCSLFGEDQPKDTLKKEDEQVSDAESEWVSKNQEKSAVADEYKDDTDDEVASGPVEAAGAAATSAAISETIKRNSVSEAKTSDQKTGDAKRPTESDDSKSSDGHKTGAVVVISERRASVTMTSDSKRELLLKHLRGETVLSEKEFQELIDDVGTEWMSEDDQEVASQKLAEIIARDYDNSVRARGGSVSYVSRAQHDELVKALGYKIGEEGTIETPSGQVFSGEGVIQTTTGLFVEEDLAEANARYDSEECARCLLLKRPVIGKNDGGACCADCFTNESYEFKSTIYHINDEHHSCGENFPESEIAIYRQHGHEEEIPRLIAEWRHEHALFHELNDSEAAGKICPTGDHLLCLPHYGFGCTIEEKEAFAAYEAHNADQHDACPEDFPELMALNYSEEEYDLLRSIWRHAHGRHELCRPYVENNYPEFTCTLEMCEKDEIVWEKIYNERMEMARMHDQLTDKPEIDNSTSAQLGF